MPTPEKRLRLMQLASSNLRSAAIAGRKVWNGQSKQAGYPMPPLLNAGSSSRWNRAFLPSIFLCSPGCIGHAKTTICRQHSAGPPGCSPAVRPANCVKKSVIAARHLPACWPTGSRIARRRGAFWCRQSQLAGMAWLGVRWQIALPDLALSLGYSWIESAVMAGVKLVPFGQQAAQQLILRLCDRYAADMACALAAPDSAIGSSTPLARHCFRPA